jgi:hypothetical protein
LKNDACEFIAGTAPFFARDGVGAARNLPDRGNGPTWKLLSKLRE